VGGVGELEGSGGGGRQHHFESCFTFVFWLYIQVTWSKLIKLDELLKA
jgi:hypothetical protein